MIITRPIRFTGDMSRHRSLLEALGARCLADQGDWVVYVFDHGRIALHTADESSPAGLTRLGFETHDLDALAAAAQPAPPGVGIAVEDAPHGRAVVVRSDITFTIDPLTPPADHASPGTTPPHPSRAAGQIVVAPLWFTSDPTTATQTLTTLGARPRIESESGNWTDLMTESGQVAVHASSSAETGPLGASSPTAWASLGFEYTGSLDDLAEELQHAGFEPTVIDEAYGRSLRLPDPDLPDEQIWINEAQRDLYGYRRLS